MGLIDINHGEYVDGATLIGGSMIMFGGALSPKRISKKITLKSLITSSEEDKLSFGDVISYIGLFIIVFAVLIIQS